MNYSKNFLNNFSLSVDEIGAKERAGMLASRSIKTESKVQALKTAISMIDLTTLEKIPKAKFTQCVRKRSIRSPEMIQFRM